MELGLKYALSSRTFVVEVVISVSPPPMMPARATGLLSVRNDENRRIQLALHAVQRCQLFVQPGATDDDLTALQLIRIEGMQRMAQFHHDVIGHVRDVVDGPHAHGFKPLPEPVR